MNIGRSFTFMTQGKDWYKKLGIAVVIFIVPILDFAFWGYLIDIICNIQDGVDDLLPQWDDWGEKWKKGFILWAAYSVYLLPFVCIGLFFSALIFVFPESDTTEYVSTLLNLFGFFVIIFMAVLAVLMVFIWEALMITYARHNTFRSCFAINEITQFIMSNFKSFMIAFAISIVASIATIIINLGLSFTFLVPVITSIYYTLVATYLYGQIGVPQLESKISTTIVPENPENKTQPPSRPLQQPPNENEDYTPLDLPPDIIIPDNPKSSPPTNQPLDRTPPVSWKKLSDEDLD